MPLEHRQADALGDHLHVGIEDRAAEVEALADDVVVSGLDQGDPHALSGCVQGGPDDLDRYRVWHSWLIVVRASDARSPRHPPSLRLHARG